MTKIEIITLSSADIDDYERLGYDACELELGMRVLCDDELYMTYEQIEREIAELSIEIKRYRYTHEHEIIDRIKMLKAALQMIKKRR